MATAIFIFVNFYRRERGEKDIKIYDQIFWAFGLAFLSPDLLCVLCVLRGEMAL
jgi:hypothetical protein